MSDESIDLLEATSALACASNNVSLATQAKGGIGRFFEDLSHSRYKSLFNPSVHGFYVLNCVKIERIISEVLKSKKEELGKRSGWEYCYYVHGIKMIEFLVFKKLKEENVDLNKKDLDVEDGRLHEVIDSISIDLYKCLEINFRGNVLGNLFKNQTKCKELLELFTVN